MSTIIRADIIADTIPDDTILLRDKRVTTFRLTYPRYVHAHLLTHRVFSRNTSSSRAIPVSKMIEDTCTSGVTPISWGKNGKGMQPKGEIDIEIQSDAESIWCKHKVEACNAAHELNKLGVHKEVVNRLLEAFTHVTTVLTGEEFWNFFSLRTHSDTQLETRILACIMYDKLSNSTPEISSAHTPFSKLCLSGSTLEEGSADYITACTELQDWTEFNIGYNFENNFNNIHEYLTCAISTVHCARVSYNRQDMQYGTYVEYVKRFIEFVSSGHLSPLEHARIFSNPDNRRLVSTRNAGWFTLRDKLKPLIKNALHESEINVERNVRIVKEQYPQYFENTENDKA